MSKRLSTEKSAFVGDPEHLQRFLRLAATQIRSADRGEALLAWSEYKKSLGLRRRRRIS